MKYNGVTYRNYTYDLNGNTTGNAYQTWAYNFLNLPSQVSRTGVILSYRYTAAGEKLQLRKNNVVQADYISGIQYKGGGVIDFIQTDEGRYDYAGGTFQYNLTDHLGNVRVSIGRATATSAEVLQEDEYYAFGLNVNRKDASSGNRYLYNGKELQPDMALGVYDYGARFYDPVIGRWTTVDPSSEDGGQESLTPYQYGLNNPIRYDDPDGRCPSCPRAGLGSNPLYVMGEGFRQMMQTAASAIDKVFVSVSETTSTIIAKFSAGRSTTTVSVDATNTTTARPNFAGYLNQHGKNTPSEPIVSIANKTKVEVVQKVEVKSTIRGLDVKSTNKISTNSNGTKTKSSELTVGKGSNGAFLSNSNTNGRVQIDAGLKATYTKPVNSSTTTSVTIKTGVTIKKE